MKITEITVSAGRTVPHPIESYANLKPHVSLKAVLEDGEDFVQVTKDLQAKAEEIVEDHANSLKTHLRDMHYLSQKQREVTSLEKQIQQSQERLSEIRKEIPLMSLPSAEIVEEETYSDDED
jgi:uncharacterized coiled-coil DUF342 family protein